MQSIVDKYGPFVKEQIVHNERSATKFIKDEKRSQAYLARAAIFKSLLDDLSASITVPATQPATEANLRLTQDEIKDLPPELLEQLSLTDSDRKEFLIAELIAKLGGTTSLDKILIALYRETGEVEKRAKLTARLYRMGSKGMIFADKNRKGVYSTAPFPENEDQLDLLEESQADAEVSDLV